MIAFALPRPSLQLKKPLFLHERAAFVDFLEVRAWSQQPLQLSGMLMYSRKLCRHGTNDRTRQALKSFSSIPVSLGAIRSLMRSFPPRHPVLVLVLDLRGRFYGDTTPCMVCLRAWCIALREQTRYVACERYISAPASLFPKCLLTTNHRSRVVQPIFLVVLTIWATRIRNVCGPLLPCVRHVWRATL